MAARKAFGLAAVYLGAPTIGRVFEAVTRGEADYGVVPLENSTGGAVGFTLDELLTSPAAIRGELVLEVTQCLMAQHDDLSRVQRVYSHPQGLAQCRKWLEEHLPKAQLIVSPSTSAAAREAGADPEAAAVASRLAAELNGLRVIRDGIQDGARNATRFVILGQRDTPRTGRDKTSLVFTTPHERGALRKALGILDDESLNLTRIESRPMPGRMWEYVFFTDLEGHREDANVLHAIRRLEEHCSLVRVLGSYPRADTAHTELTTLDPPSDVPAESTA
jgi:chorismate mutase/prephenate dehydratase